MSGQPPIEQRKAWLGVGWAYPVAVDPATSGISRATYEVDIRQSINIILGTAPGERVMRADFGCGIHDLVFESLDTALITRIETSVRDALTRYEARVEVLDVSVDTTDFLLGRLIVELQYRVRKTNQTDNLVYPFYFRVGGIGMNEGSRTCSRRATTPG